MAYCPRAAHPRMSLDRPAFRARHRRTIARLYEASDGGALARDHRCLRGGAARGASRIGFPDATSAARRRSLPRDTPRERARAGVRMPRGRRTGVGTFHPRVPPEPLCGGTSGRQRRRPRSRRRTLRRALRTHRARRRAPLTPRLLPRTQPADDVAAVDTGSASHRPASIGRSSGDAR